MNSRPQLMPRTLRRTGAATYLSISPTTFDAWVKRGLMPQSKRIEGIVLWDRYEIDDALQILMDSQSVPLDAFDLVSV